MTLKPSGKLPKSSTKTTRQRGGVEVTSGRSVARHAPPIPSPPDLQQVSVRGLYTDQVSVVAKTVASLHLLPGRLEADDADASRPVLVPFAEMRLGGGLMADLKADEPLDEDFEPGTVFTANLSMENFAFILLDLTSDLARMCSEVAALGKGDLAVDPARMAHVRYFVAHLERQARSCRLRLDNAFGAPALAES